MSWLHWRILMCQGQEVGDTSHFTSAVSLQCTVSILRPVSALYKALKVQHDVCSSIDIGWNAFYPDFCINQLRIDTHFRRV